MWFLTKPAWSVVRASCRLERHLGATVVPCGCHLEGTAASRFNSHRRGVAGLTASQASQRIRK